MKAWKAIISSILFFNITQAQNSLIKEWDWRYGGFGTEGLRSIIQTVDKGFILGGSTYSRINGDISQDNWDITGTTNDYWIVKTDSMGVMQWNKRYGGIGSDYFRYISHTNDGGFIMGGFSNSDNSGVMNHPSRGGFDYWIIKIDSLGNHDWNKNFGGGDDDLLWEVRQTSDGGYILGGYSYSGGVSAQSDPLIPR